MLFVLAAATGFSNLLLFFVRFSLFFFCVCYCFCVRCFVALYFLHCVYIFLYFSVIFFFFSFSLAIYLVFISHSFSSLRAALLCFTLLLSCRHQRHLVFGRIYAICCCCWFCYNVYTYI